MASALIAWPGGAQLLPVRHLGDHGGPLGPDRRGGLAEVAAQLGVGQRRAGRGRERLAAAQVAHAARRGRHAEEGAHGRGVLRVGGEDLGQVHGPDARAQPGQAAADVHQAGGVAGRAHLGPGVQHAAHLVGQHRGRGVARSSPRTCRRSRSTGRRRAARPGRCPRTLAQQPQRLVADPQQPQRVAGRVVGDPVRVVGADVVHPEHVHQQLGQLVGPRRPPPRRAAPAPRRRPAAATIACWCRTEPTHDPDGDHDHRRSPRTPRRGGGPAAAPRAGSRC